MTRQFPVWAEEAKRYVDRLITRLIKVGDEAVVGPISVLIIPRLSLRDRYYL
jgi:hypothetical protein